MKTLIEKFTKDYSDEQIAHLTEIFVNCSKYELGFWNIKRGDMGENKDI